MTEDSDKVRKTYNRLASEYDFRWQPYISATLNSVLEKLNFAGTEKILDVPCGTGELERLLLAKWPELRITGTDISPGMLREARVKVSSNKVSWIEADVANLPFSDSCFDCVVCANSFHYFRHPVESLKEIRRTLRTDGMLLLIDWCDDYWVCKLCSLWLRLTHRAFYKMYGLRRCHTLLEETGFRVVESDRFRTGRIWGLMRTLSQPQMQIEST